MAKIVDAFLITGLDTQVSEFLSESDKKYKLGIAARVREFLRIFELQIVQYNGITCTINGN